MGKIQEAPYQKFTEDVLIIGAAPILVALSGLLMLSMFTKYLGAHDYGIWAQVMVTIGLVLTLITLGLTAAMTKFFLQRLIQGR